jgi:hypothetical protein
MPMLKILYLLTDYQGIFNNGPIQAFPRFSVVFPEETLWLQNWTLLYSVLFLLFLSWKLKK